MFSINKNRGKKRFKTGAQKQDNNTYEKIQRHNDKIK
jgi:hypothetical protein